MEIQKRRCHKYGSRYDFLILTEEDRAGMEDPRNIEGPNMVEGGCCPNGCQE